MDVSGKSSKFFHISSNQFKSIEINSNHPNPIQTYHPSQERTSPYHLCEEFEAPPVAMAKDQGTESSEVVSPEAVEFDPPRTWEEQVELDKLLLRATENGRLHEVKELLQKRADVDPLIGRTPFQTAAQGGHREIVKLLLQHRASIMGEDFFSDVPLHYALAAGSEMVETIVTHLTEQRAWSVSVLIATLKAQNQDGIVTALENWPQDAKTDSGVSLERLPECLRWSESETLERERLPEYLRPVLAPRLGRSDHNSPWIKRMHARLDLQNLFLSQEVPVSLKCLPGVSGSDVFDNNLLETLARTPHDVIFGTDAVQAIVLAAWQQYRAFTFLEIGSCFSTVVCLCRCSYGYMHESDFSVASLFVIVVLHAKKTLDESVQLVLHMRSLCSHPHTPESYITFDNAADLMYLVTGWMAVNRQLFVVTEGLEKPWMAMFSVAWLRLLYSLRGESWMGPRLLPILSAIKDTFAFFMLTGLCLAAATHAYYNLQLREEPTPSYAAMMQVVRLGIFGDFDLFEFEGLDPVYTQKQDNVHEWEPTDPSPGPDYVWVHCLFYFTGVGITVLLMNVLIAVLGANYERYEDQSSVHFLRARVKMLVELQSRPLGRLFDFCFPVDDQIDEGRLLRMSMCPLLPITGESVFRLLRRNYLRIPLLLCSPVIFVISLCFLIAFLLCLMLFCWQGMSHTFRCALGIFPDYCVASKCSVFFLVRKEPDINDVRSLRTEMKRRMDAMGEKLDNIEKGLENKIEKGFAELRGHLTANASFVAESQDPKVSPGKKMQKTQSDDVESDETSQVEVETMQPAPVPKAVGKTKRQTRRKRPAATVADPAP